MAHNLTITPTQNHGSSRTGTVTASFNEVVAAVGFEDNMTENDDGDKVQASYAFKDQKGREAYLWLYKYYGWSKEKQANRVMEWSADGDKALLEELFPGKVSK